MRFSLLLLIILGIGCNSTTNNGDTTNLVINSVVANDIELTVKLTNEHLITLDSSQLRLIRNEIFARKGYEFKSPELVNYFSNFDWYKPQFNESQIADTFTEIDNHNVELIRAIEKKKSNSTKLISTSKDKITFKDYLTLIPELDLPLEYVCEDGFDTPKLNYENDTIKKFKPQGAAIIGKLYQTNQEVALIYGYPADIFFPIVQKYDLNGGEIFKIKLFKLIECVDDMSYSAKTIGTINKDYTVSAETIIIECETDDMKKCDTTKYSNNHILKY